MAEKNQHQGHTKEKSCMINLQFLQNWEGKKEYGEQNTCIMYVSGTGGEGNFESFPWWLKMWKVQVK